MDALLEPEPLDYRALPVRQLSRLVEVSVTLNSTLELSQLLLFIMNSAAEILECEAASILLYDEKRGILSFISAAGAERERLAELPVPLEGSLAGTIFRQNRPLLINRVDQDPRHYSRVAEQINFQPRSLLGVPMRIREKATGVLEAVNKLHGEFCEVDTFLLSVLASQAAVAIHNAQLLQALQKAYDDLSRIDKVKSDFMAIASHELRTPLGVILGYATFLAEESQGELNEHARVVLNSAFRLRAVVEAMTNMDQLRIRSNKLELHPVALQKILRAACETVWQAAIMKLQVLSLDLPEVDILIEADEEKLGLVFANLLNNAIRFTSEHGQISVGLSQRNGEAWVKVRDTGMGIPQDELENIFSEFYQVEDHMTRVNGGLGLGLAIARGLVDLHNGRIWAESEGPNKGSTFTVVLPLSRP